MKNKILIAVSVCLFAIAAIGAMQGNTADKKEPAVFKSFDMAKYPQGGFNISPAHAEKGMKCVTCHDTADPILQPIKEKWPAATKCSGCHKTPSGTLTTKDYKTNTMRTFDPHNSHEKGGCLTCHSEHYASRLSCNVGGCHDFKDLTMRKK